MINWIKECVEQPNFSVLVNGESCGFFKGTGGLRQGCPVSPHLSFALLWSSSLRFWVNVQKMVSSHHHSARISHLLFADDVMIFADATP